MRGLVRGCVLKNYLVAFRLDVLLMGLLSPVALLEDMFTGRKELI